MGQYLLPADSGNRFDQDDRPRRSCPVADATLQGLDDVFEQVEFFVDAVSDYKSDFILSPNTSMPL